MTQTIKAAFLIPYDSNGTSLVEKEKIVLDFNPETLTLGVQSGQADRGKRGRQEVQAVGKTVATLSFDAYFDTTRPREDARATGTGGDIANFDVRRKTSAIARLLEVEEKGAKPAPRRVLAQQVGARRKKERVIIACS